LKYRVLYPLLTIHILPKMEPAPEKLLTLPSSSWAQYRQDAGARVARVNAVREAGGLLAPGLDEAPATRVNEGER
jgi:hypothetical protein